MQGLLDTWENAFWHFVHIRVNDILSFFLEKLKKCETSANPIIRGLLFVLK